MLELPAPAVVNLASHHYPEMRRNYKKAELTPIPNDSFTLPLSLSLGWENPLPAWVSPGQAPSPWPGLLCAAPSMIAAQLPTGGFTAEVPVPQCIPDFG